MIYPLYGLMLLTATLIITLFFQERYDQRKEALEAQCRETASQVDQMLTMAEHHVRLVKTALMNPASPQIQHLPEIIYDPEWDGFSVQFEVQTEHGKLREHLTGEKRPDLQDPAYRRDYLTALTIAPLLANTGIELPDATRSYYLSKRGFMIAAPWSDPDSVHFTRAFYDLPFYKLGTPSENPSRSLYWTGAYLDEYGKRQMITVGAPVYVDDQFQGVTAIDLTMRSLSEYLNRHNSGKTDLLIRNGQQQVLAHSGLLENQDQRILNVKDILPADLQGAKYLDLALEKKGISRVKGQLIFNWPLQSAPWSLTAFIDENELRWAVLTDMKTEFILLVLMAMAIVLVEYNRRTQRALQESEHRFREMTDLLPEIIFEADGTGRITFMNLTGLTRLGYSRSSLEHGLYQKDLYYRVESTSPLPSSLLPDNQSIEYKVQCSDGTSFPALLRTSSIREGGIVSGERGILIDISKLKNFQNKLETLAITDPLTGCYNHRMFIELAHKEFNRSQRSRRVSCLLMLDLDFFKRINDNWGHQAGDDGLVHFVNLCRKNLREGDILGRMGGEEFAILMPDTDVEQAETVAERIRNMLEGHPLPFGGTRIPLTVSIGVSEVTSEGIEVALSNADEALYEAKHQGRNQVISWIA
jgi:diguanylate cyclase (GGDEF)-like protein/PAS domain S-box-containing protein